MIKTLRTLYGFLLGNKLHFAVFVVLVVITNIGFSLNPYFYKLFVETIPSLNFDTLFRILLIFMATRVFAVVSDILCFYIGDKILFESSIKARTKIFKHIQNLDFAFHSEKSTGSLISAFKRGDSAFFSFFHDIHHRILSVFINFTVMIYFLFQLDLSIVVLVAASLVITLIATHVLVKNNTDKRKVFNKEEDEISGIITDNLINFETVKLFAKESWENSRLKTSFIPWLKALWSYGNSFRLIDGVMGLIINTSIFLILLITINKAVTQQISIADFVLITGFVSNFYPRLWDLVWGTRDLAKNYADIEKYFDLLDYKVEVKDPEIPVIQNTVAGEVEFKKVSHSYKSGTKNAVKDFSLTIKKGEAIAFVGKSGSGKTTITKLLMRYFDPERGKILIDGIDIKNLTKSNLRSFMGVVPQEPVLFNNTIAYNISYGARGKVNMKKIKEAAQMANIHDFIQKLPKKYESNVGERGIKLSGGQKQRLAIARMILSDPSIIIFDEATSHLDSESEKLIQDAFWKASKGKTTIIIAHRLSTIMKANRIVVMEKGEIREIGTHRNLLKNKEGIYKHLWDLQIKVE